MPESNYINNFAKFREDFKQDTGWYPEENMSIYIQYANLRISDYNAQKIFEKVERIDGYIGYLSSISVDLENILKEIKNK